ncbi:MBG domain-containing protein [Flavobacterium anhuiense]|uniref:MBG domain-containing protein n=1 Tax=Flavobacterium anhuiense TaxID=459526 RepID=UPI001181D300|nr:MBG domain-containing protein [Flavobacterium anhuiense]
MEKNYFLILKSLIFVWYLYLQKIKTLKFFKKQPNLSRYTLLTCFFLFTVLVQSQTVKYVTVTGAGNKDGSSWANASDNLQRMISTSEGGTQVWIARGIYTPKVALAPNTSSRDRNNTFGLKKDVKLYGGFLGNETDLSQRNGRNETILSGNLGGGSSAHHVVLIHALEENENYYINGLTISDGSADLWEFYKITEETKGISTNDKIKEKYPDWFVSMTESPYYNYTSLGLQLMGISGLPGVPSIPGGDMTTTTILNTSYPKSNGGAIYNIKGVLTLENVVFKDNNAIVGGAICVQDGGRTTLTNCTFSNNKATDNGGAISNSNSYLTITGGSFTNNSSSLGGAISDLGGRLFNINDVSFSNNQANKTKAETGFAGAIFIEKATQINASSRIINNCIFNNNSAEVAGAIFVDENNSNLKITNSSFTDNKALMEASVTLAGGGGAIVLRRVINAEVASNNFSNNKALKSLGGATLLSETKDVKFSTNTFSENTSLTGGALYLLENKNTTTLTGNTFTKNSVTTTNFSDSGLGGAVATVKDNNVKISDNIFTDNTATRQGGAIHFETITVNSIINNNTFKNNKSSRFGGAILASSTVASNKLTINNNTFESNNSSERGGGLFFNGLIISNLYNNEFVGNKSLTGAAVDIESSAKTQFFNNTLRNNIVNIDNNGQVSGVLTVFDGENKLYNNVFTGNEGVTALFYPNSNVDFVNNTMWNENLSHGIYNVGKQIKLYNNIIEQLEGSNTSADVQNNAFRYDDQNKYVNKNNNIREANLYFVDAINNNFNLTGCSPLINKGNNSLYSSEFPNTDLAGKNRKVNSIDIGAYENELGASAKTKPTVVATQAFCGTEAIVNDLKATGTSIKWYGQALGGNPLASNTALVSGNTYYASQNVDGCESDRASVTVSISSTEPPTAQTPQNFIIGQQGARIVVNGSNLKWYTQEQGGTALTTVPSLNMSSENSATYWVSQTNANNCESVRSKIVVNVTKIPLTIKAINKVKLFDGIVYGNSNYTISYAGFESGDSESNSIAGALAFSGDATTAIEPGVYKIIPQGITSSKYTVLFEEGTLEIKSNLSLTDNTLYVKQNGNGDGSSWNSSLNNLELALTRAANINSVHTDDNDPKRVKKIFVAKGTYQLASGKSYVMPKNVEIYGGFDPDNAITNLTHQRITGNVNDGSILRGNNASVIKNDDNGLTVNAVLNGFTITNGNAANGGGIYNKKVAAKFENCIIRSNNATANGGAVYNENANTTWVNCLVITNTAPNGASMYNNASLPTLLNATIADNTGAQGAALFNANGSSARILNSVSVKNSSDIVNNASNPSYENSLIQGLGGTTSTTSVFDSNYLLLTTSPALNAGKNSLANIVLPSKDLKGKSRIIDTTVDIGAFERNKVQTITATAITKKYGDQPFTHGTASSGLPLEYISSSDNAVAKIEDGKITILSVGTATITVNQKGNDTEYDAVTATFVLTVDKGLLTVTADNKVKIKDDSPFTGFTVSYSGFVSGDVPDNSLGGSLTFSGSATTATNIGDNYTIIPSGYTSSKYEIVYNPGSLRIEPDITLTDGTLYVKKGATGDGTSWSNALGEVRDALDIARLINSSTIKATKIFVSAGQYSSNDGQSFAMVKGVSMYGSFDPDKGITALSHKRKFGASILSQGARGNRVITNDDNKLTNADIIDGFTIGGSFANVAKQGGGIYNRNSSPTIVNCIITDNSLFPYPYYTHTTYGGGLYNDNSSPILINCIIKNSKVGVDGNLAGNSAYYGYGSAMYNVNNSKPKLYNCTIKDNYSISGNNGNAPAIVNDGGSVTTLYNSIYMNNNKGTSSGIVSYNSIVQKDANIAEGLYNNSETVTLDAIFKTNSIELKEDSYAKDRGANGYYTFNGLSTYDINGYNRLSGTIDVGAEELRSTQNIATADLTKIYGDADFTNPSVTVASGLPLTYTKSSNANVASIKDGKIHILTTGTATITVSQAGNENYAPAEKTFGLTIDKATLTVKANDKTKLANNLAMANADYDVSYTGFVNGDDRSKLTGSLVYSGNAIGKTEIGIYADGILPSGLSSNNYNFIYKEGTLKILPNTTLTNNTLYVKQGTVGGDGSSWQLALSDLSLALRYASIMNVNTPNTVNKIYVAKGSYTPKYSSRDNSNYIDEGRDNSFLLLDGVKLYGGFDGNIANESLTDRHIQDNKTILDGQSLINHIITVSNAAGNNEIDGFYIVNGEAASAAHGSEGIVTINGKSITREYGGGIRVHSSNVTVKNCFITKNNSGILGGGIYVTNNSNVSIYNTLFYGNSAYHYGATGTSIAISDANVKIVNATFGDNTSASHIFAVGASNLEVFNAVFRDNQDNIDINRTGAAIATVKNSLLSKAQTQYSGMTLANNFYAQPADFVDANANNFALKTTSAAVNKGDNSLYNTLIAGNKDLANSSRFLNTTIDMGCYESKIAQTINVNDITKKYTDADFAVGSASSNLSPLTYSSDNKNVAYITKDNKIHITGVGQAIITVAQSGDEIYAPVTKNFKLTVEKGDFTATLNAATYTYDGSQKYLNVTDLPAGTSVSYEGNGQINAGDYVVKANINGGEFYNNLTVSNTLKINKKDLSGISFNAQTFTYDGFDKHPDVSGTLPEGVNVVYSNTQKNAGVYNNVKASLSGSNYKLLELTTSMTITKSNLANVMFLLEKEEVYDGTVKRFSLDGTLPDGVTVTYTNNDNINVGSYNVTVNINGGVNYNNKQLTAKLTIVKGNLSDNFVLASNTYVYDGTEKSLAIAGSLPNQVSVSYTNNNNKEVGNYKVYAVLSKPNYNDKVVEGELIINPKSVNVIVQGEISKVYNGNTVIGLNANNFVLEGIVSGDNVTLNNPAAGTLDNKDVGINKAVTIKDFALSGTDSRNYVLSATSLTSNTAMVKSKTVEVALKGSVSKIFDGTTQAVLTNSNFDVTGILENEVVTLNASLLGSYDTQNVGKNKTITVEDLTIGGVNASNYVLSSQTVSGQIGEITPKDITVTADALQTKVYGATESTLSYTFTPSLVSGDSFTGTLKRATGENIGTYAIKQGTLNAGTNYNIIYVGNDFKITAKTITVTADASQTKVYGESDAAFTYSFAPSLESGDSFTGTLSRAFGENIGTYAIAKGSLSAGTNYTINFVSKDYTITAKPITVTADASQKKVYGAVEPILTSTVSPALIGNDTFTGALSRANGANVGLYAIKQGDLSAGSNYTITFESKDFEITPKEITVSANASQNKFYGEIDPTFTYTASEALAIGNTFSGSLSRGDGENVGTYNYTIGSLAAGSNYNVSLVGSNTFEVKAKPITVTADTSQTKVYGTEDPVFTYSVSPSLVGNDAFSGILERATGENVGPYAIAQGTLTAGGNYTITYKGNDFEITTKTIAVTADSQTKVYGESDAALTYSFAPSLESGDSFTGILSRAFGENIGAYAITKGSLSAGSNYTINFVSKDYTITAKPITVTADASQKKVYGAAEPILTSTVSPALIGNDTFTGALSRANGANVGLYPIEQGDLSAGSNYTITFESKDFEITPKEITLSANASQNKFYGEIDPTFTYTASEVLATGNTFSGSLSREDGENAGTYNYTIGSLAAGSNYTVTLVGSNTFEVKAKPITVTADASQTKVYGTEDPVFTYSVSPSLVGNDAFSGILERATGENVGPYVITQGTLTAGGNYTITYVGKDFEITAKTIAVTADSQTKVYGESDAALTYSFTPSLESGDSFTGNLSRVLGENIGAYTINQGTLSAGSNYSIDYVSKDYTITAKPITVTADASQKKVYGSAEPVLTSTVSPALIGNDTFTGALSRVFGEDVDFYAIEQGDLSAGPNYTITFESKDFEITPKEITVTAEVAQNKFYGEADSVFAYTASEALLIGNTFSGNLSRVKGENAGTYKYTIGSLSAGSNYNVTLIGSNTFEIKAKSITVTADASQTKVYGTTDPTFTYAVSPSLVGRDAFSGVLKRGAGENVGTYAIAQGTLTAGDNYVITYVGKDFEITKADQVITWNQTLVSNCEGVSTNVLTASSNSGLPITYVSSNLDVVTISNNELTYNNSGTATITASQAGNNNYNAAENIALPVISSQANLIRQQFEDVIFFDNSSKEFKSYTWYKNGILIAGQTLQYYKEVGGLNGTYYAVATKLDGTVITSCPLTLSSTKTVESVRIYPNPVRKNETYQLITNLDPAQMLNAHIEVFGMNGSLVDQKNTNENETTLLAPAVEAVYIVRITLANGKSFTKNLLVKN